MGGNGAKSATEKNREKANKLKKIQEDKYWAVYSYRRSKEDLRAHGVPVSRQNAISIGKLAAAHRRNSGGLDPWANEAAQAVVEARKKYKRAVAKEKRLKK